MGYVSTQVHENLLLHVEILEPLLVKVKKSYKPLMFPPHVSPIDMPDPFKERYNYDISHLFSPDSELPALLRDCPSPTIVVQGQNTPLIDSQLFCSATDR